MSEARSTWLLIGQLHFLRFYITLNPKRFRILITRFVTVLVTVVARSSLYLYNIATLGSNVSESQMHTSAEQIFTIQRNDAC
jgi:hypothetical protein